MAGAASGADAFWYTSFGDEREAVPWAEFEAKLRTSMVTSDGAWEAALPTLKSAIETTGGEVKFATFRASFSTSDASYDAVVYEATPARAVARGRSRQRVRRRAPSFRFRCQGRGGGRATALVRRPTVGWRR